MIALHSTSHHLPPSPLRSLPVEDIAVEREPVVEVNAGRIGAGDEEGRALAEGGSQARRIGERAGIDVVAT